MLMIFGYSFDINSRASFTFAALSVTTALNFLTPILVKTVFISAAKN
jgi:hypothetical protein